MSKNGTIKYKNVDGTIEELLPKTSAQNVSVASIDGLTATNAQSAFEELKNIADSAKTITEIDGSIYNTPKKVWDYMTSIYTASGGKQTLFAFDVSSYGAYMIYCPIGDTILFFGDSDGTGVIGSINNAPSNENDIFGIIESLGIIDDTKSIGYIPSKENITVNEVFLHVISERLSSKRSIYSYHSTTARYTGLIFCIADTDRLGFIGESAGDFVCGIFDGSSNNPIDAAIDALYPTNVFENLYFKPESGIPESDLSAEVQAKLNSGSGSGSESLKYVMPYQGTGKMLAPEIVDANTVQFTLPKKITLTNEYTFDYYTIPIDIQVWENSVQVGVGITIPFDTRIEKQADNQVLNCTVRTTPRGTGTETQQNTYRVTFNVVSEDTDNIVIALSAYTNFTTVQTVSRENGVYFSASRAMGWYGVSSGSSSGGSGGESANIDMPIIRLCAVGDANGTMVIDTYNNPLKFTVEIIAGHLEVGDELQFCKMSLFTKFSENKRKYRLRPLPACINRLVDSGADNISVTDINSLDRFWTIYVNDSETGGGLSYLYMNNGGVGNAIRYLRVARYYDKDGNKINRSVLPYNHIAKAKFSNVITMNIARNINNETNRTRVW